MSKKLALCLLGLILFSLVACGGGGSGTPTPTPTPIPTPTPTPTPTPAPLSVTPTSATVPLSGSQQFTASGTAAPVTWSLNGIGTLSPTGFYIAPAGFTTPGTVTVTVTATSIADNTKTVNSSVNVVYPNKNNANEVLPIKLGSVGANPLDVTPAGVTPAGCCIGTLGSAIQRGASLFILSNNHVLARSGVATNGETIDQRNSCSGGLQVGTLSAESVLKPTTTAPCATPTTATLCGPAPNNVDAAIASTTTASIDSAGTILELGPTATTTDIGDAPPSATTAAPTIGMAVAKSGRTTGLTCSSIQSVGGNIAVDYDNACGGTTAFQAQFSGQIVVSGGSFIQPGDSGSLLVTAASARPVGLLYAGGSTSAIANPISDVLSVFNNGTAPTFLGGADHTVSCQTTASTPNAVQIGATASALTADQRQITTAVRDKHAARLMSDRAVRTVSVGASADNPKEGAVVIELTALPQAAIPATLDGVRTRVVFAAGLTVDTSLSEKVVASTISVKDAHLNEYFGKQGIRGVAVGRSTDNPTEPAIFFYTTTGVANTMIPPVIDGIRTKVVEGSIFHAY